MLFGLIKRGIKVVSYAADGTEVERSVQRLLVAHATSSHAYTISHPIHGHPPIKIVIAVFYGQCVVMIQDSKHALKTFRNNICSGGHMLILGRHVVMYSQLRLMAFENDGPLYSRDVEKLDRQDDNAATRLFCANSLEWLTETHPELLGLIVYLFVFGETIDAYQNRHISHTERVKMVLRTLYFLEMWEKFLDKGGYSKKNHLISREACDIVRILVYGLLQLILVFRDHLETQPPLLPWLLTTEVCEHVFGLMRTHIADFTMLDFYHMIPKLFIQLRQHTFSATHSTGKARASGYSHTYTDNRGLDLAVLSSYPSDEAMETASTQAYREAESLFFLLGVMPSDFGDGIKLPSIGSWFSDDPPRVTTSNDTDTEDEDAEAEEMEPTEASELEKLQNYVETITVKPYLSSQQEHRLKELNYAAITISMGESTEL